MKTTKHPQITEEAKARLLPTAFEFLWKNRLVCKAEEKNGQPHKKKSGSIKFYLRYYSDAFKFPIFEELTDDQEQNQKQK